MQTTEIGYRIKVARENAHITQDELACAVGCTTQHISAIERGIKTPRLDTFIVIANTLGTSADVLLQDVLEHNVDPISSELSSAFCPLTDEVRQRLIKALRAFAE